MNTIISVVLISASCICAYAQPGRETRNLFIITLDGLRWQELFTGADSTLVANKDYVRDPLGLKNRFWHPDLGERRKLLMPFLWEVIGTQGQLYGNRLYSNNVNCSNRWWFSYPGYSEILCGFADDQRIRTNNRIDNPNQTVLEFLNAQQTLSGKVAAFGSWDVFPYIINETRSRVPVNAGFKAAPGKQLSDRELFLNELQEQIPSPWSSVRLDAFTHHYAVEYIKRNEPNVLFIAYGETDDFAHDGRYDAYLTSAHQSDKFIRHLWELVQSHPLYKGKTTFIITTDHGRGTVPVGAWKNHGSDVPGADQIWLAVIGPDTEATGEMKSKAQYYQNQVAKTAAALLGYTYKNEKPVGEPISSVFKTKP
jgi:hypothetical protein